MSTHRDYFSDILKEYKLAAGIVVARDGSILAQAGDHTDCADLLSALVGPYGDVHTTFDSLEGQLLPRMWTQGECFAIVDRPAPELMIIVFGCSLSIIELYHLSKRISASIKEKWAVSIH